MDIHFLQFDWHEYGVDWEGPVPTDDDNNTVFVHEEPDMLSASQKLELRELLSQGHVESNVEFSRQHMISQLAIAKSFVNMRT